MQATKTPTMSVELLIKVPNYLAVGVVVWVINPFSVQVLVYEPQKPVQILSGAMILTGGTILPGFAVRVDELLTE